MFHKYVLTYAGKAVSLNRLRYLMDQELAAQAAEEAAKAEPDHAHAPDGVDKFFSRDQYFYGEYCWRHRRKYGEPFGPDVDPDWS